MENHFKAFQAANTHQTSKPKRKRSRPQRTRLKPPSLLSSIVEFRILKAPLSLLKFVLILLGRFTCGVFHILHQWFARPVGAVLEWLNAYPSRIQYQRTTQRFLAVMNSTESYATYVEAAASLDHYWGVATWCQEAPPPNVCDAVGLLADASFASKLSQIGSMENIERFLLSLLLRNAHGMLDVTLYSSFFHGVKFCIEDYTRSIEELIEVYAGSREQSAVSHSLRPCWIHHSALTGAAANTTLPAIDIAARVQGFMREAHRTDAVVNTAGIANTTEQGIAASSCIINVASAMSGSTAPAVGNSRSLLHPTGCATCYSSAEEAETGASLYMPFSENASTTIKGEDGGSRSLTPVPQQVEWSWTSWRASPKHHEMSTIASDGGPNDYVTQRIEGCTTYLLDLIASPIQRSLLQLSFPRPVATAAAVVKARPSAFAAGPLTGIPPLEHKLKVLKTALRSLGRTALVLSGGASMGSYHAGVARALHDAGVLPEIMAGSSAGSIIASFLCTKTPEALRQFMASEVLSTEAVQLTPFGEEGGGLLRKVQRFFKTGYLMDVRTLMECMREHCGDMTFWEAFQVSGKVLNVSVTRSQQSGSHSERHMLLNYLTAPNVVIWSAVSASCALPGLFTSVQLIEKSPVNGDFAPFLPGELWCDGSVAQDVPRVVLSQLFAVNFLVVSQVNPYVIPFLPPPPSYDRLAPFDSFSFGMKLWYSVASFYAWVLSTLCRLNLIPRTGPFELPYMLLTQRYTGHVTIHPISSLWSAVPDYLNLVNNPSADYISYVTSRAQNRTWPFVARIRIATAIERCLVKEIQLLEAGLR